jgi:branched-chain amino acid transport system permease protein
VSRLDVRNRTVRLMWRVLGDGAKARWRRTSPFVQRAVPPVVIAVVVLLVSWAVWVKPSLALIVLLLITYAMYLLPRDIRRWALPVTVVALAVLYPILLVPNGWWPGLPTSVPIVNTFPAMTTMVPMAIFVIMAIGLNMVVGYAGLLDLGYVAFYAIGAYTAAWFASPQGADWGKNGITFNFGSVGVQQGLPGIHISPWLVVILAGCLTAACGIVIGLPTLRLRGDYLAIVTLGFGEILPQIARNGDNLFGVNITGGAQGITPVDSAGFGSWPFVSQTGTYINQTNLCYWVAIVLVLITVFCSVRLRDSRLGRAWIAIREDETAAAAMGVPLMRTKTWSYAAGAFFGGIAGCWYAVYKTGVFPDDFSFNISVFILCMVILGGMGNIWGVIVGACFLSYLDREGLANIGGWLNNNILPCDPTNSSADKAFSAGCVNTPLLTYGIYGSIIALTMLFRPQGLIPEERRKLELEQGVHDESLYDERHDDAHIAGSH